ncbi:MAG: hypothetical protein V4691_07370 [Pseudomonadota bacterium]
MEIVEKTNNLVQLLGGMLAFAGREKLAKRDFQTKDCKQDMLIDRDPFAFDSSGESTPCMKGQMRFYDDQYKIAVAAFNAYWASIGNRNETVTYAELEKQLRKDNRRINTTENLRQDYKDVMAYLNEKIESGDDNCIFFELNGTSMPQYKPDSCKSDEAPSRLA